MRSRHLLSIRELDTGELTRLIERAMEMKAGPHEPILEGRTLALLFEKPSLRTRVSFDVAMYQMGGHCLYLSQAEVGLGTREAIADIARTLSRYVDAISARTFAHASVESLARHASVPVINALSDEEHPCQALADILTIRENKGVLTGVTVAYVGDANNVAASLMLACALAGMRFRIASPKGYEASERLVSQARGLAQSNAEITLASTPEDAVSQADVVYTDVWTSMGQEAESRRRRSDFEGFQIDERLLSLAAGDAILMHPLPAHYGEELATDLADCPRSVIFDQAENRLHAQKAVLAELLSN